MFELALKAYYIRVASMTSYGVLLVDGASNTDLDIGDDGSALLGYPAGAPSSVCNSSYCSS